jgi:uncharacterized protein with HEPN domain
MEHDIHTHLYDIVQSCQNIRTFTCDIDYQTYIDNIFIKSAVERQFIIIGEALNRIKRLDMMVYNQIRYAEQIISFRNILVHGYDIISDQLVWQVVNPILQNL